MLNRMGANISGIASNRLTIVGTKLLRGATHRILPDMIEIGSFIGMGAMVGDGLTIKSVSLRDLGIIPDAFRRLGIKIEVQGDDLFIPGGQRYEVESFIDGSLMTLADAPLARSYPPTSFLFSRGGYASEGKCAFPPKDV